MTNIVAIPTRGRWDRLEKITDAWLYHGFRVVYFTELDQDVDASQFLAKCWDKHGYTNGNVNICYFEEPVGKGIGHARNRIVDWADREGIRAFVMSDDDCYPSYHGDARHNGALVPPSALLEAVKAYPILACAASHSQQNHFLGGLLESHYNEVVLAANGICFQMFAINTERALDAGNFDPSLKVYEDSEFMRCGIKAGFPWGLHTGVRMVKTGRSGDPGGIQDYIDVAYRETALVEETRNLLADRWGEDIIARPPKRARQSWAKMYDRYIPNWKKFSAGHGGSLKEML